MMLSSTERRPFWRTTFCCTSQPSCTWPTSLTKTVAPFTTLIGMLLRSSIVGGVALVRTVYCVSPIFAVPAGKVRFWALTALTTSQRRQPLGQQLCRVDIDHDLPVLAARRRRQGDAGDRRQLLADPIDAVVIELLFAERVGAQADLQHRDAGGVVLHDDRRLDARRHQRADRVGRRRRSARSPGRD